MLEEPPSLIPMETLEEVAPALRVLAHPVRLRIVEVLLRCEVPVGELAEIAGVAPNVASQHLNSMRAHGIVTASRRGKEVYYRVAAPEAPLLISCIRAHRI